MPFGDSQKLTLEGDIASQLVDGVDRFLLRQIEAAMQSTGQGALSLWPQPNSGAPNSPTAYLERIEPLRQEYRRRIGCVDPIAPATPWTMDIELDRESPNRLATLATAGALKIVRVRWAVLEGWDATGLMIVPERIRFGAVLIPDAGQMPESLCGNGDDSNRNALQLAQAGGLVIVPQVVSRHREARMGRAIMTDQEFVYRSAFELGRHLLGYQVQQCIAAIDRLKLHHADLPILVGGWGEGGWVALATGASDVRVDCTLVAGHFGPRDGTWQEPIHRNVHGLLPRFGDAQLACLIAPRALIVDETPGPDVTIDGQGGAPGRLLGPAPEAARREAQRARTDLAAWNLTPSIQSLAPQASSKPDRIQNHALALALSQLRLDGLTQNTAQSAMEAAEQLRIEGSWERLPSPDSRRLAILQDLDRFQQRVLDRVHLERDAHWKGLDTSSLDAFQRTVQPYHQEFREQIIGVWNQERAPLRPRTRLVYDREKWRGYEVVLDVFDEVIAYGVLLVPKTDAPIAKRPCVVFQHGLEGRPTDTIVGDHPAYHDVSAQLAEQGYVVFAPQNLYLFGDRFRTLQRKSNLIGKTLFSTIVAQHEQIVKWLGSLPEVDPDRIAFYGLSYGGKSAMRIPAVVPEYCLSICSADFNDWVWKNASTSSPYSYVWTMEYEIFEFDLGPKFNYAEMARLIAPRPFMVERGHFDGVAPDERVALEYAKVQRLYAAQLGIPDRSRIEWFAGPHTIHGVGTFEFLKQHLKPEWMQPATPDARQR